MRLFQSLLLKCSYASSPQNAVQGCRISTWTYFLASVNQFPTFLLVASTLVMFCVPLIVPEELLSFMGVMYPSSSVSPLVALSPRKMVGSALYLWPPLSSPPAWLRLFLCRLPLQRWSSRAGAGPPAASWFTQAWAPVTEPSAEFGPPSR